MKTENNKPISKDVILKENEFDEKFHNISIQTDNINLFLKMEDSNEKGQKINYFWKLFFQLTFHTLFFFRIFEE